MRELFLVVMVTAIAWAENFGPPVAASWTPARPRNVVCIGDIVFPQVVAGGGWSTTVILTNLSSVSEGYTLLFWTDDGATWRAPIVGQGRVDRLAGTLRPRQCVTYETDTSPSLEQGWAIILPATITSARIGGLAVFRQRVAGRPDFEAVVPISSAFDKRFVLLFDNAAGFSTGVALTNADPSNPISVTAAFQDEAAGLITEQTITLPAMGHTAFSLPDRFPITASKRGSVAFQSSGRTLSGLGLRFNPSGAFTSFHGLSTVEMVTSP
jgi:hypothetical protein